MMKFKFSSSSSSILQYSLKPSVVCYCVMISLPIKIRNNAINFCCLKIMWFKCSIDDSKNVRCRFVIYWWWFFLLCEKNENLISTIFQQIFYSCKTRFYWNKKRRLFLLPLKMLLKHSNLTLIVSWKILFRHLQFFGISRRLRKFRRFQISKWIF